MTTTIGIQNSLERTGLVTLLLIVPDPAVAIPITTHIITNSRYCWWQLLLSYVYFILTSHLIFEDNVLFVHSKHREKKRTFPKKKLLIHTGCDFGLQLLGIKFRGRNLNAF